MNPGEVLTPEDAELLARFETRAFTREAWTHEMHVRVGWIHLCLWRFEEAMDRMRAGIKALNESNGVANDGSGGYHETVTRMWLVLIANAPDADRSSVFLERNPGLLQKDVLLRNYSREVLMSPEARKGWVRPDLQSES